MKSTNILTNSCRTLSVLLLKPDLISLTKFDSKKFKSLFLRSNCDDFFKNNWMQFVDDSLIAKSSILKKKQKLK